jgi:hypothetical protein
MSDSREQQQCPSMAMISSSPAAAELSSYRELIIRPFCLLYNYLFGQLRRLQQLLPMSPHYFRH